MTWPCKAVVFAFFMLAMLLTVLGCGDDDDDDAGDDDDSSDDDDDDSADDDDDDNDDTTPDVDDLIEQGKEWLAFPDGDRARLSFLAALEIAPDHPEALYGLVLSDTVHTCNIFSIVVDYVLSVLVYGGPVKGDLSGDDLINGILQHTLNGLLRERVYELLEYAQKTLAAGGTFEHDGIPIIINLELVADLHTEFDDGELYASSAFAGIFSALIYQLYAVDLDFDLSQAFRIVDLNFDAMTTVEIVSAIVQVALDILMDPAFPDFLTIPQENAVIFQEAGLEIGDGLDFWTQVFPAIDSERDDPTDDVMGYADLNGNRVHDFREPYVLPHFGALDESEMKMLGLVNEVVAALRDSYYDYTAKDVDPDNPNPFSLILLRPIVQELGLPAFLIPDMEVDIGAWFVDPAGSGFRETLITILRILDLLLPDYFK